VSTPLTPENSKAEIMTKLEQIEKRVDKVEVDVKKVEKKVRNMSGWFWPILIGGLIGWFWDDIIALIKSFFLVAQ